MSSKYGAIMGGELPIITEPPLPVHRCVPEHAALFWLWLQTRDGLFLWNSVNLSNPGQSWTSPATTADGKPYPKPHHYAAGQPSRHIRSAAAVVVDVPKEVKRFRIGIRAGAQGMTFKVTDGGSRKIRAAVAKAGEHAWYAFDYGTQEAVIFVPDQVIPLQDYILANLGSFDGKD